MKIKEFKKLVDAIAKANPDLEVYLSSDVEGNSYSPFGGWDLGKVKPEEMGKAYLDFDAIEYPEEDVTDEELFTGNNIVIFSPEA